MEVTNIIVKRPVPDSVKAEFMEKLMILAPKLADLEHKKKPRLKELIELKLAVDKIAYGLGFYNLEQLQQFIDIYGVENI